MQFLKEKVWPSEDIALLKGSALLFGVLIGLALPRRYRKLCSLITFASVALAIKPLIHYFREELTGVHEEDSAPTPSGEL